MSEPRVACVGTGAWGQHHARNLHALGVLDAVVDRHPDRAAAVAGRYGVPTRSFEEALATVDALVIATPAATHAALALRALEAGRDVLVEKPLAMSIDDGRRLVDAARRHGRVLMVGHLLRYHPAFGRLEALVAEGALGRVRWMGATRLSLGRVRQEEDVLFSLAPHDVSMLRALARRVPLSVACRLERVLGTPRADIASLQLDFGGELRAQATASWLHPVREQRLVVIGEHAVAVFDDLADTKLQIYDDPIAWEEGHPAARRVPARAIAVDGEEPLRAECAHFLECVRTRATPRTDGVEALGVLAVLDAARRSAAAGGEAVRIETVPIETVPIEAAIPGRGSLARVHPSACIDDDVVLGEGTTIWHFSHVLRGSRVGKDCRIGQNVVIGPEVEVGDGVKIQNNVSVYQGVTLEDHVFCGPSMVFTNVHNPRSEVPRMQELRPTRVRRGATLGANCTILCGTTIGRYAFVGAGAVVLRDVPDHALVVGNPARAIGWMCRCGVRLTGEGAEPRCAACGAAYVLDGAGLVPA